TTYVHRTTPVSESTHTSATCTPPTWTLDRLGRSLRLLASWILHWPVPLTCSLPSMAQTFFQSYSLLAPLSRTLPGMISRSSTLASSFLATLSNSSSRALLAATSVAGACVGMVVLPPEPCERPYWLSPISTLTSLTPRPRTSAATRALTVRWPVP